MEGVNMLFKGEKLEIEDIEISVPKKTSDDVIDKKYIQGEVRIVTEQARYPLPSIPTMLEGENYDLNPEFQRRHRWSSEKKSRLIESFIMNVPGPPIFLYEDSYSHYEVMDGLQRLTAIFDFYTGRLELTGLQEWPELNHRRYDQLPDKVRRGVDRRYISSIILLQETAKTAKEAQRLKQMVFERINSGGEKLEPQESRNAIYNGPLNQLCISLARNPYLCRTWFIPEPDISELESNEISEKVIQNRNYRTMSDVELVLRFFAYRQRLRLHKGPFYQYLDSYLKHGNLYHSKLLSRFGLLFEETIKLVYRTFGSKAFFLRRMRNSRWSWYNRPTTVVYDPLMFVFSKNLVHAEEILEKKSHFQKAIRTLYQNEAKAFEGRYTNKSNVTQRNRLLTEMVAQILDK
jgi:hypothetical protein